MVELKHLNLNRLSEMYQECVNQSIVDKTDSIHHVAVPCFLKSLSFPTFLELGYYKRITARVINHYIHLENHLAINRKPTNSTLPNQIFFIGHSANKQFQSLIKLQYSLALIDFKPIEDMVEELTLAQNSTNPRAAIILEYNQNQFEVKELIDKHSKNLAILAHFHDKDHNQGAFICKKLLNL